MDSFPSSWIITPTESGSAQLSRPPQSPPPSPTPSIVFPRFEGPAPPRRREHFLSYRHCCECDGGGNHDDKYPPFLKDYPPWPIFFRGNLVSGVPYGGVPRTHPLIPLHQHRSAPNHGQSHRSRSMMSTVHPFTEIVEESSPPPPHPEPYGHYSTHFPSTWLIPVTARNENDYSKRRLSSASSIDPYLGQATIPPKSNPKPKPPPESPAAISSANAPSPPRSITSKLPVKLPIRNSTQGLVGTAVTPDALGAVAKTDVDNDARTWNTDKARDLMAELKGERPQADKEEQIGIWVERVSRHGSFPSSSTNGTIMTPLGAGSDEESKAKAVCFDVDTSTDCSDASGLGDAPHVTQGMHENYSIYSESTNKAEQAAKHA